MSSSPTQAPPSPWLVRGLIGLLSLIWGSTWVVIAVGLESLPPFTSAGVRFLVAALVMALVAPRLARREGGTKPAASLWLTVGTLSFAASYAIVYWSEERLPSSLVCILWSVFPILMGLASHFFLGHRLQGLRPWLGFGVGFLGVVLLFATDLRTLSAASIPAAAIALLSPLVSCVATTVAKKHGQGTSSALLNRNAMAVGAVLLCGLALLLERDRPAAWNTTAIASVLFLALPGTVLTFGIYYWLLRHTPAHVLSLISYLTPAVALVLGPLVQGEHVGAWTLVGGATILCGVFLVVGPRKQAG